MADVNQEIRVQLVKIFLSGALRVKIPSVFKIGQSQTKSIWVTVHYMLYVNKYTQSRHIVFLVPRAKFL